MAQVLVNETSLTAIADAIRGKNGSADTYKPGEMAAAISSLPSGADLPEEAFLITGDCSYRCARGWDWFINLYGDRITTTDIRLATGMFNSAKTVEEIPFDINVNSTITSMDNIFQNCEKLKALPRIVPNKAITIPTGKYNFIEPDRWWDGCQNLREIPDDYFSFLPEGYWEAREALACSGFGYCCYNLYSLREVPMKLLPAFINYGGSSNSMYKYMFNNCYALNEIVNLPVETFTYSSNQFTYTFDSCARLKNMTFATNEDGSPIVAQWKSQVINLAHNYFGWISAEGYITKYNSGITIDTLVTDDASYQALKDNPDYWNTNIAYSRYNHDSAVATINSLPDTSAYLATAGGTNTIKFKGAAGSKTDGGAINTLTEEEIAVATAKGWTVTFA